MSTRKLMMACLIAMAIVPVLLAGSRPAFALAFKPSEQEWNAWSAMCRARYVVSGSGVGSGFSNRVSKAEVAKYEAQVGGDAWYWLHHYCAGLVYINRAQKSSSESEASKWLREADVNIRGQYEKIDRTHYLFPEIAITLARVYKEMDDSETAMKYLDEAIRHQPGASSPYALAALLHREDGHLESALEVLLIGNSATENASAELHFLLGHIYIEMGDLDLAVEHAEVAYELGYPLPGLASKLRRLGRKLGT